MCFAQSEEHRALALIRPVILQTGTKFAWHPIGFQKLNNRQMIDSE
jgi:hypothetical protein